MEEEKAEATGAKIAVLALVLGQIPEKDMEEVVDAYAKNVREYEAIGILDGNPTYFKKLDGMRARERRARAILHLIQVSRETQKDLDAEAGA